MQGKNLEEGTDGMNGNKQRKDEKGKGILLKEKQKVVVGKKKCPEVNKKHYHLDFIWNYNTLRAW